MVDIPILAFLFFVGLSVGSFVNVIVLRFGFEETPLSRSHCMACNAHIRWYDLVPVFSFLFLRGRCRDCGSALTAQYPLVELAMGVLFALAYLFMPPLFSFWSIVAFCMLLVFLAALVGLVVYDVRHTLVPLQFVYVLAGAALLASVSESLFAHALLPLIDSALGGAVLFAFFAGIVVVTKGRGMGMGDGYVAAAAGFLLGLFRGIEAVMFGVWIATAVYIFMFLLSSLFKKTRLLRPLSRVTIASELPFVPFLALGIIIALFTDISPLAVGQWLAHTLWF